MDRKTLAALHARFNRAMSEMGNVAQILVDENNKLEDAEVKRSEAFDALTKGDGETMALTSGERELIVGMREGRYRLVGAMPGGEPPRIDNLTGLLKAVEDILGLKERIDCPCPACTAEREAATKKAH